MHLTNPDGTLKLDKLGRRIHINSVGYKNGTGRKVGSGEGLICYWNIRMTEEMRNDLIKKARKKNTKITELIRTYIEWGLENDK